MKKLLLLLLAPVMLSAFTVKDYPDVNKKTVAYFEKTHADAVNSKWFAEKDFDVVYFTLHEKDCRIWYDKNGNFVKSIRYYDSKFLPIFIREKIKSEYPNRTTTGVTELSSNHNIEYHLVMNDDKNWYNMQSDANGNIVQLKKYKRADVQ